MEWTTVTGAITNLTGVCTTIITTIADNAYLMVFLAAPVIAAGVKVVKKLMKVSK